MSESIHMPFLARNLTVTGSPDAQLMGLSGMVVGETRRTIAIDVDGKIKTLAKNVIEFTLDNEGDLIRAPWCVSAPRTEFTEITGGIENARYWN